MTTVDAARILAEGGRLLDAAVVVTDGEVLTAQPTLAEFHGGDNPYAVYGIRSGPGRVSALRLGSRVWREIDCDFELTEQSELRVRVEVRLPDFTSGEDCAFLRALAGAETLPALDVGGRHVTYAAEDGALCVRFPSAGAVRERGRVIGFAVGETQRRNGSTCAIVWRVVGMPVAEPRAPIADRAFARTLGDRVATDGSATYRVDDGGNAAECDGARLKVYRARAFDVVDGKLYALGEGFVTDGEVYAAAPTEAPIEFRAVRQGELRFFFRFADRWEAWDFRGNRLFAGSGVYTRMAISADYALFRNGAVYDLRDRKFAPITGSLLPMFFAWEIEGEGFFGDIFYAVKKSGERFYCRLGDMENFVFAAHPNAAAASNGFMTVYASGSDVYVDVADRGTTVVKTDCGRIERLVIGRDCVYVWGEEGDAALYGDAWLTTEATPLCYVAGGTARIDMEANDV